MKRDESLLVLQHALGLDDYGRGKSFRNHYVAGEGCDSWGLLMEHVASGRMTRRWPNDLYGGGTSYCFTVTDAGREYVRTHSPQPPKQTRAQKRYQAFLDADCGLTFFEWIKGGFCVQR